MIIWTLTLRWKACLLYTSVDVLITGHTHASFIKEVGNILLLNPGSPTVPRMSDPSVMVLEIKDKKLDARIIKIEESKCKSLNFKGRE